jgi:hypothetical protein
MRTMNKITGLLSFALTVVILIIVLKALNWVPLTIQKDTFRRYGSIDEVRTALNIRDIYVPSYFPQHIVWPPSEILAQGRPFPAVVMEFKNAGSGEIVLVLTQSRGEPFPSGSAIDLTSVKETVPFMMKGRSAVLVVGECMKNEPCSKLTWTEDAYTITALMKAPPFELTRIADSMLR